MSMSACQVCDHVRSDLANVRFGYLRRFDRGQPLPVYPRNQTCSDPVGISQRCHGDVARHLDMREVVDRVRDQRLPQPHLGDLEGHEAFTA